MPAPDSIAKFKYMVWHILLNSGCGSLHKNKSGDTERDSTRRTQKGRYSALLENHMNMARDSARDFNTIETVKNLKEVKNFFT